MIGVLHARDFVARCNKAPPNIMRRHAMAWGQKMVRNARGGVFDAKS